MSKEQTADSRYSLGLNDQQVAQSRAKHGNNILTPPKRTSLWKLYLDKYRDPIIQILLVAALISLVLAFIENDFVETIGIIVAVLLATTIGFYFERDAVKKFSILTAMNEDQLVKVRRNGHVTEIPRRDVVVGDIILIETGDEIPADGRLIKAINLQVNESSLTGEPLTTKAIVYPSQPDDGSNADTRKSSSDDAPKGKNDVAEEIPDTQSENPSDAKPSQADDQHSTYPDDMVLRSTMVINGHGEAVVTAVGDSTEIGKVAKDATSPQEVKTPLSLQLDRLASFISKIGGGTAVAAFLIFLVHDILTNNVWHSTDYFGMAHEVLKYFMMAVTLIVMAVPEGLPMAVTLTLALNMRRMLQSNNLVRKLHASETMGAVTVICTDKTGTLTQNQMQVADLKTADSALLNEAIAVNTTAELDGDKVVGNPTEGALLIWLRDQGTAYAAIRQQCPTVEQVPFSTENKFMATTTTINSKTYTFIKGAPEKILQACQLSDEENAQAEATLHDYQHQAMRTLALACREGDYIDPTSKDTNPKPYTLQALVGISDPVRQDVPKAVAQCNNAGIEVKIVTGDTRATTAEIAKRIGIVGADEATDDRSFISGEDFAALSDDDAAKEVQSLKVMYRARPTDKERLVKLLQRNGHVVAVTGDGTNDAPALNHAHVGLSLGSGTSVAKEASDITLLDDSFGSIVNAVMWGRSLYKNIQRFLFFQLVVNVSALLLVIAGAFVGTEMPLTVTQILWVNLIMDTFAALALASLPPSREYMKDKPRNPNEFILTKSMQRDILFCGGFFFVIMFIFLLWCERHGSGSFVDVHELTWFFTTFVMLQFWNLFNAKCLGSSHSAFHHFWRDRGLILVLVLILLGQWLIVTFGDGMFRTVPLSLKEWIVIILCTSPVMIIGELWRWIQSMRKKNA
jgi:Ca2+-transporting ATPase